jgi:hypothetical protein
MLKHGSISVGKDLLVDMPVVQEAVEKYVKTVYNKRRMPRIFVPDPPKVQVH